MKNLSIEELANLSPEEFAEAWKEGQIHASAFEMLGLREYKKDENGNLIPSE